MLQGLSQTAREAKSWPFEQARLLLDRITRLRLTDAGLDATADAMVEELTALGGKGGFITVTPQGEARWAFNTPGMYRGVVGRDRPLKVAIYGED